MKRIPSKSKLLVKFLFSLVILIGCARIIYSFLDIDDTSSREIRVVGSSTVYPFTTIVSEHFAARDNKPPVVESTGTGGGMKLFCGGVGEEYPDFTNASRAIKQSEISKCQENNVTPLEMIVGYDGIVFANSTETPTLNITRLELYKALAKVIPTQDEVFIPNPYTKWNEINPNFPAVDIEVLGPPPSSGTRDAWVELVMEGGCKQFAFIKAMKKTNKQQYKAVCHGIREDGVYIEAGENDNLIIQKLVNNKNAFGIFGFSFLDQNRDQIHASSIEKVEPENNTIADGSYPASRALYVYAKKEHFNLVDGMIEFIDLYLSDRMAGPSGILNDAGLIPLSTSKRNEVRELLLP